MLQQAAHTQAGLEWPSISVLAGSDFSFWTLLENLSVGAYTCDAAGLITYFNHHAVRLWGRAPKLHDPVDRFCGSFKLFLPDGSPITHDQCWMALALTTGKAHNGCEIMIERPDGQRFTLLAHANPIYHDSGRLLGAVNVLVDITERKQTEEIQQYLAAIIESSDDAIIGKTLEGVITSWNRGAERLYGYRAEEILGQPVSLLIPPDLPDEFPWILERLRRGEVLDHYETQRLNKDGRRIDVSLTVSPIRDASGRIIGASKIARDITERKRAEQARKESEERLRLALDAGGMGAWEVDLRSGEAWIDASEASLLGLPPTTQRLQVQDFLDLVYPEDRTEIRRKQAMARKGNGFRAEFRILHPHGQVRWLRAEGSTLYDAAGQPQRVIGINYDITAHKQVEDAQHTLNAVLEQRVAERTAALEQAHEALRREMAERQRMHDALVQREKLAALGTLLANVAHELNNPLSVAAVQLDNLAEAGGACHTDLALLRQAVERCQSVVQSFLALARQQPPTRQAVDLHAVLDEALALLRPALTVDDITVECHLAAALPPLWGDPHQVQHVVLNLLTNAQHALRQVAPPRHLTLAATVRGERQVTLQVSDNGPGIPAALQSRIFEPFFTTKPQGVGSGLGLPLCRNIVEGHGGTLHVTSAPGRGTTFYVTLPVASAAVVPAAPGTMAAPQELEPYQRGTILLIDDEPGMTQALTRLLQRSGHTLTTAANGREGLAALAERAYDVILCDMRMPDLDGPGVYDALAQRQPHLLERLIFLTGDVLSLEAQAFFTRVKRPRLIKPFKGQEVRQAIQQVLAEAC